MGATLGILGTSSGVGKGVVTSAILRILSDRKISASPFKGLAMSIGRDELQLLEDRQFHIHQIHQALAARLPRHYYKFINPAISIGERHDGTSSRLRSILIQGRESPFVENGLTERLRSTILESHAALSTFVEHIIFEGCSPAVEHNLIEQDISNIGIGKEFKAKYLLVTDINNGGAFSKIKGTYDFIDRYWGKIHQNEIIGCVINKASGDARLLKNASHSFTQETGIPIIGIVPESPFVQNFGRTYIPVSALIDENHEIRGVVESQLNLLKCIFLENTDIDKILSAMEPRKPDLQLGGHS